MLPRNTLLFLFFLEEERYSIHCSVRMSEGETSTSSSGSLISNRLKVEECGFQGGCHWAVLSYLRTLYPLSSVRPIWLVASYPLTPVKVSVAQLCPTVWDPMDCSPLDSSVHGILQARILEWVTISFSGGSSWPRDWTWVSCIGGRFFTVWVTCNPGGSDCKSPGRTPSCSLIPTTRDSLQSKPLGSETKRRTLRWDRVVY